MAVYSSSQDLNSNVQVNFPSGKCCNCGSGTRISSIATDLKRARFMVLGGTEITLNANLPYCPNCMQTAARQPVGTGSKLLVSCIVFFLLLISLAFIPSSITNAVPNAITLPLFFLVACGLVFGFYSLRKPAPNQTSYYQPVRLKKVKQKFTGEVTGYVLAFTNQQYQREFASANKDAIGKKTIEAVSA